MRKKVLVVGGGIAGSMSANLLQNDLDVILLTKESMSDCNSMLAQGGIASAYDSNDSPNEHFLDSMIAGSYLNNPDALNELVVEGPKIIQKLIDWGMKFDKKSDGSYSYGLEGAHKIARILHSGGDKTGEHMTSFLQSLLKNIEIKENTFITELIVENGCCIGVKALNQSGEVESIYSDYVILATGGIGGLYPITSNDSTITGDGISIAYLAGCELSNMEFVQFHPTLLSIDKHCYGLISEAVRGEGAVLVREDGSRIMKGKHEYEDLAPRDVVSRELAAEILKGENVFLDISSIPNFTERFPGITENLKKHDIPFEETGRIPVQPGAHFFMGGIKTDLHGETNISNLFAIGETACTGVHGANRLASNSLLEAIVFANEASLEIKKRSSFERITASEISVTSDLPSECEPMFDSSVCDPEFDSSFNPYVHDSQSGSGFDCYIRESDCNCDCDSISDKHFINLPDVDVLKDKCWNYLGITRTEEKLEYFIEWISQFDFLNLLDNEVLDRDILERRNLTLLAYLIAKYALNRKESIGAHFILKK
ncbi:MAG: L-aspartate oxidase [Clostridioides sp.]|jgi:L-aspartate oxidase|nr:L-aspartate oxidase [Clostridioides sp.]